jgi:hypothetical protein
MMCCAVAALLMTIAALRGVAKPALKRLSRWSAPAIAVAVMLAGGSALAAYRLDRAPQENGFASFLMQHICGVQGDDTAPGRGNTKR